MLQDGKIFVGKSVKPEYLELRLANRHGLITGATGTGKTVTLQVLAEGFSDAGVSVFAADIKGDLSGIAAVGEKKDFIVKRVSEVGLDGEYENKAYPTVLWDVFGQQGHPVRATVADMGPLLLSRLLELNEVQEGVLAIAFRVADDEKLPLLDLKDLRAIVNSVGERAKELTTKYGNVSSASVGAIQRRLLVLEDQGAGQFFGEPALDIKDFLRTAPDGRGIVNLLSAEKLMEKPRLYGTFLLWMLTKLWATLPEVGDQPKPKLVFFFDEAHLLFDEAPRALLDRIEQVARLIRSKGVGVYFVTQNPLDVPDTVSAQLGNRVQHALRAFTPKEQRAVKAAAETFRANPDLDAERVILELKVGEALVSMLENKGEPSIVQRTLIRPPQGRIGPLTAQERQSLMDYSPVQGKYEDVLDRESAHEMLAKRSEEIAAQRQADTSTWSGTVFDSVFKRGPRGGRSLAEQVIRDEGSRLAKRGLRQVLKSILPSLFKMLTRR
ncbi:MAG: helicase HerA-like domain-containing protein [Hyphomicrobiaceae bacterium]